eukprot:60958-Rhodomonas_salina.2
MDALGQSGTVRAYGELCPVLTQLRPLHTRAGTDSYCCRVCGTRKQSRAAAGLRVFGVLASTDCVHCGTRMESCRSTLSSSGSWPRSGRATVVAGILKTNA